MAKLPGVDEILGLIRDGKSRAEVAAMYEVTEKAVYQKLYRAGKMDIKFHRVESELPWKVTTYHKNTRAYQNLTALINLERGVDVYPPNAYMAQQMKKALDEAGRSLAYDHQVPPNPASPTRGGFYYVDRKPGDDGVISMPDTSTPARRP